MLIRSLGYANLSEFYRKLYKTVLYSLRYRCFADAVILLMAEQFLDHPKID